MSVATRSSRSSVRWAERARPGSHTFLVILALYFLFPFYWLIVASTKTLSGLFDGSAGPLWFDDTFALFDNLAQLFTYKGGVFWNWIGNSFFYAFTAGVVGTAICVAAGYGFAKYRFAGRRIAFALLLGAVMVPMTALVIPTFVMLRGVELTDTPWAVILPSMLNPFGVYLMRVFAQDAIPDELLEAARMDGSGELRAFVQVGVPLLRPGIVTVLLLSIVSTWNNYFLPLTVLTSTKLLPVTVGLQQWQTQSRSATGSSDIVWNLVTVGSLVSIIPLVIAFLALQRYWRGGLSIGAVR
jgi:multiple sugar transport system permease protein